VHQSTTQDWEAEARKLLQQGNETQARDIFLGILGRNMEQFKAFQQHTMPYIHLKPAEVIEKKTVQKEQLNVPKKNKGKEVSHAQPKTITKTKLPFSPLVAQPTDPSEKARQELMVDFSEKRLGIVLSIFPIETLLLQSSATNQAPLLYFILNDINRAKLFIKTIVNNYTIIKKFTPPIRKLVISICTQPTIVLNKELRSLFNKLNTVLEDLSPHLKDISATPTLAHIAVFTSKTEYLVCLYHLGADFNIAYNEGQTPLSAAVLLNKEDVVTLLLLCGADPNKLADGESPLHIAATKGSLRMVKLLLKHKADPNKLNARAHAPLHLALFENQIEIANELLDNGADPNQKTTEGLTPALIATNQDCIAIIEKLHQKGADFNQTVKDANCIYPAILKGHLEMIKILHAFGASLNQKLVDNSTPAHFAVSKGNIDIIQWLLEHNMDFSTSWSVSKDNLITFLQVTMDENGAEEVILSKINELIERQGAKEDTISILPIDIAEIMGREDIMDLIKGANMKNHHPYAFFTRQNSTEECSVISQLAP
ncbi:Ankyrin repeat, partial [Legionella jamestowniensis DSM 19215]